MNSLLFIDDNAAHVDVFRAVLAASRGGQFRAEWLKTLAQGTERLRGNGIWAIFANLSLPDSQGLETLDKLREMAPDIPILVLAGEADGDIVEEALRRGARDCLLEGHIDLYAVTRVFRSLGEGRAAEEAMFLEKERAQVTLNSIGDAVLSTDNSGNVTYLNVVAEKMTGWSCKEALGRPLADVFKIIDGVTRESSPNPMEVAISENKTVALAANCILIRRDGSESAIEDSAAPIHDRSGAIAGAVMVFHDVSVSKAMVSEMSRLAHHDSLTGLPNRILLKDRLGQAIATAHRNDTRLAVLFLDLDGFKSINDSLGHRIGDRLLRSVAARLVGVVRGTDTVSRQGGDEFVVVLTEIKRAADAGIAAKKMVNALSVPHKLDTHELRLTASIGISTYPEDGDDAETLMKNADTAMYRAKASRPKTYQFFEKDMNVRAVERQSVEADLGRALKGNEFVLNYQPKIDLKTGELSGAEALIRWQHPKRGLISPRDFVPIAEECGLIVPIGQWVLRETCRQIHEWIGSGLRVPPMAVNVSPLEFRGEGFLEDIRAILRDANLDARYLDIELTESSLMLHAKSSIEVLTELKSIGVRLSLDDFGTGYSSLGYLKWLPIDSLKIDQSFVSKINSDVDDATLVSTMIAMAKSLKKRVVAEGVETEDQFRFLQEAGCDEAQGYYFSQPVSSAQFAKVLQTGTGLSCSRWATNGSNILSQMFLQPSGSPGVNRI